LKRYLPKNAEDASALIITLLVVLLLSTVAVSFLSTARMELTATRNYSAKTRAEQFATSATEQAMAKIQQGFNTTNATSGSSSSNNTQIVTTQPGRITKYFFLNGNCTGNATEELFSGTGNVTTNGTANLNNLQNPGNSTGSAASNQWTITGNASERINVPLENINSNGTVVGRIAYYVDDEGTKLNVNNATGNRTTLNVGARPQDIAALISGNHSANFNNTINGTGSNATSEQDKQKDIKRWAHFFRPEQVSASIAGFSGNNTPFLSTATTSASTTANMTHLLTPWGTQRIAINMLSTNATDGTGDTSVTTIHSALTNSTLTAIFGRNFADKYGLCWSYFP
jgi:type II secretory pathway component PulK